MASGQTLYLWIDVKTDGPTTFPYAVKALQPLRDAGYLTTVTANGTIIPGPVTVIGPSSPSILPPSSILHPITNEPQSSQAPAIPP